MAVCDPKISSGFEFDCDYQPVAGTRDIAYIINFNDITSWTPVSGKANTYSAITLKSSADAYKIQGINYSNIMSVEMVEQGFSKYMSHKFAFVAFGLGSADLERYDTTKDGRFVIIVYTNYKGNGGDGNFKVLGLNNGLVCTLMTQSTDDEEQQGAYHIEFTSHAKALEPRNPATFLDTNEATTFATLESYL